mmetsp:Transcript_103148/g.290191  ORF Transcript_103148/g.290191 Transcript_103148/m.290191 type:complete len:219 (-) Transcript_103148:648-1304(-)
MPSAGVSLFSSRTARSVGPPDVWLPTAQRLMRILSRTTQTRASLSRLQGRRGSKSGEKGPPPCVRTLRWPARVGSPSWHHRLVIGLHEGCWTRRRAVQGPAVSPHCGSEVGSTSSKTMCAMRRRGSWFVWKITPTRSSSWSSRPAARAWRAAPGTSGRSFSGFGRPRGRAPLLLQLRRKVSREAQGQTRCSRGRLCSHTRQRRAAQFGGLSRPTLPWR